MTIYCVIPARGGSKRIPRKNLVDFHGTPMIGHAINIAKESKLINRVIVSTDDLEISQIAKKYGGEVPRLRSAALSDDFTGTNEVIRDAIEMIEISELEQEILICLYPTAVLLSSQLIDTALETFISSGMKSPQISLCKFSHPIERAFKKTGDQYLPSTLKHMSTRTQDLEERWFDAGQFYIGTVSHWKKGNLRSGPFSGFLLSHENFVDIDTVDDLNLARKLFLLAKNV